MQPTRLFDVLEYQLKNHPLERSYGHRLNGEWIYYSTEDMVNLSDQAASGLLGLGLTKGDKVAIIAYKNRPEWTIMDLAIQKAGLISIPVYPTISSSDYEYIFNDAGVKYAFVGGGDLYDKVAAAKPKVASFISTYTFDRQEGRPYWEDIFSVEHLEKVRSIMAGIQPDDLFTIIYTSGTTGNPKGVMLTHNNILSNTLAVSKLLPAKAGETVLSFLPLCHIFERNASFAFMLNSNPVVYTGTDNLGGEEGDLKAIRPYYFNTVPRLLEKVYEKIYNKGLTLTGVKKKLFFWALKLTDDYEYGKKPSGLEAIKWSIADKLIFSKWREALGGNVKGILTGAAACPVKIARVFSAAGVPVREAYGLTETSPGLTINTYDEEGAMLGTVGPAIEGVELYIDPSDGNYQEGEGEILARGPNIMKGYYNKPDKTAEVFKEINGERWFCTGDVGKLVKGPGGKEYLKITDRKKELLKTSGGKYVAPAPVENKFKEDFLIEQMMVVGEKQKFVSALIVPAEEALRDWCKNNGVEWTSLKEVIKNPKVIAAYQKVVDQLNPQFSHIEQIKKFSLLPYSWDATKTDGSAAELTPTMKLKRRVIMEKFNKEIEHMYDV